jgi:hypothetical protein
MARISATARNDSLQTLREHFKPGQTVYTILRHCSASGMTRDISVITIDEKGDTRQWDYAVANVLGYSRSSKGEGVRVSGCGMDMGFHLVYSLGRALWPAGTEQPHGTRNGTPDTDGGYALKQRWM